MMNGNEYYTNRTFKFNKRSIENLPAHDKDSPSTEQEYSDIECRGLKVCVSKNGRRFFVHRYRFRKGKKSVRRCIRLGEFPALSVTEARQMVNENKRSIALGQDPLDDRQQKAEELTFEEFFETEYMPNYAQKAKKSWKDDLWMYNANLKEEFGERLLSEISKHDISKFFYAMKEKTSEARANRYLSLISKVFSTAIDWEFLDSANPCGRIKKFRESAGRTRYLTMDEIKRLKNALDSLPQRVSAHAIWFLLTTGCRLGEAMSLTWKNIDFKAKLAHLPKEMTKNGEARFIILNEQAIETLKKLKKHKIRTNPFVFPGTRPNSHLISPRRTFTNAKEIAGIKDLRLHDLRHSFASLAISGNNTSLYTVSKLLGHKDQAMTMRYSHLRDDTLIDATESVASQLKSATE